MNNLHQPLISLVIPCYNQGKYLSETLNSVLSQSYSFWECIIINDGSSDHTEEISLKWTKKDPRIQYFSKPNGGLSSARNFGLTKITGQYVQFLDADDMIESTKFEKSINALSDPESGLSIVICGFKMFDTTLNQITQPYCDLGKVAINFNSILIGWDESFTIPIHCAIFPAIFFEKIRFDETLRAKEDWIMWLSVFKEFDPQVIYINDALAVYRSSSQSMSSHTIPMYENTAKAFDIVFKNLIGKDESETFFKKVNDFWKKEALFLAKEIGRMNNAKYFKMRKKILNFFSGLRINLKN